MREEFFKHLTSKGKDFLDKLLKVDPKERITVREALSHEWFMPHEGGEMSLTETIGSQNQSWKKSSLSCMKKF